jgi:hypothetical protein
VAVNGIIFGYFDHPKIIQLSISGYAKIDLLIAIEK